MLAVAIIVLVAGIVALAVYLNHQAVQRRIAALSGLAASKGWTYSRQDPYGLPSRWDGTPFDSGYARRAEHVLTGEIRGRPLVAFDYQYKEDSAGSDGKRHTSTYQFGVCVVRMPGVLPEVHVSPEGFLSRVGKAFGGQDIELESEDFNRAYRVRCDHPKLASDVLHPRTMEMLLRCDPRLQFRFWGHDVICWGNGRQSPGEILVRAEVMSRLVEGVPAFVWKDHSGRAS